MNARAQRWPRRLFLFLTCSIALYAGLSLALGTIVRSWLDDAFAQAGAYKAPGHVPQVEVMLLSGGLRIHGLVLLNDTSVRSSFRIHGHVDTLVCDGLSYWGLLRGQVAVEEVSVRARDLRIIIRSDTAARRAPVNDGPDRIMIGSADLVLEGTRITAIGPDTSSLTVRGWRYYGNGIALRRADAGGWSFALPGARDVRIDSVLVDLHGEQCVELASLTFDQPAGTCVVRDAHFGPYADLETFAKDRPFEIDVAECVLPSVRIAGITIPSRIGAEDWSARSVLIERAKAVIYRDKTRPDGESTYMPLLARLVRRLPSGAGVDSIGLVNGDITYNERATVERGFGKIPFHDLNATLTGLRHGRTDSSELSIHATCRAFERTAVDLVLRTDVLDTTDRFEVVARIGRMPCRDLNDAFGPLADISVISGVLDTAVMRLSADDRGSRGRIRLAYHDLRMVQGDEATAKARTRPMSVLMNALIPNEKEEGDLAATDETYTVVRRRDRSMFNYLWINLREGAKKVVLPGLLVGK